MRTHRLAQALNTLATFLKSKSDMNLTDLKLSNLTSNSIAELDQDDVLERLELLQAFQKIKKRTLVELIDRYRLPVKIRPRDAASNLLTKVGKILLENPQILQKIRYEPKEDTGASKELLDALGILLRQKKPSH